MKISSTELRRVIQSVIRESYEDVLMPAPMPSSMPVVMSDVQSHGEQSNDFVQQAQKCIGMAHDGSSKLTDMCIKICAASERNLMAQCMELCMCACKRDLDGCCRYLSEICQDPRCAQICADCCGC